MRSPKVMRLRTMRLKRMRIGDVVDEDGNIDADADGDVVDGDVESSKVTRPKRRKIVVDVADVADADAESLRVKRPKMRSPKMMRLKMRTSKVMRLKRMRIGDVVDEDGNIDVVDADTDLVDTEAGDIALVDGDVESLKVTRLKRRKIVANVVE